jgi:hypothetical protein
MNRMPRLLAIACATVLLSGCSLQSVAESSEAGYPSEYDLADPFADDPAAFWLPDRTRFDVIAFASSTCDLVPTKLEVTSKSELSLVFVKPGGSCAGDVSSTTYTFVTPDGVANDGDVTVTVTVGETDWTIPISDS